MRLFKISKDVLAAAVAGNTTMSGTLRTLGMGISGGNFLTIKNKAREWEISTTHWTGSASLRGRASHNKGKEAPLDEVLVEHSTYSRGSLKRRLIRDGILSNSCSECRAGPVWNGKPLVMVLDHINGIGDDCRRENLRLLCPNCNSQTQTFCGRNVQRRTKAARTCGGCGCAIGRTSVHCRKCTPKTNKIEWPGNQELLDLVRRSNVRQVAIQLGVAFNAVKSRLAKIRRSGGTADTPASNTGAPEGA